MNTYHINSAKEYTILHITDSHLFADANHELTGINTRDSYLAILDAIQKRQKKYDMVICSGDITQDHTLAAYQYFEQSLSVFNTPCFWIAGNHDEQHYMQQVVGRYIQQEKHILLGEHWSIILLNSQVEKQVYGLLSEQQLAFLQSCLQRYAARKTIIVLHHHVVPSGCDWLDQHQLQEADKLQAILCHYPQVQLVLYGHIHQEFSGYWQSIKLLSTPSTCFQFKPHCKTFTLDNAQPAFREIHLTEQGDWMTTLHRLAGQHFLPQRDITGY